MTRLQELIQLESKLTKEIARLQGLGQYGLQLELQKDLRKIRDNIEKHKRRLA